MNTMLVRIHRSMAFTLLDFGKFCTVEPNWNLQAKTVRGVGTAKMTSQSHNSRTHVRASRELTPRVVLEAKFLDPRKKDIQEMNTAK